MYNTLWSIFIIFLKLGSNSFGGPIAQLDYFFNEFVEKRKWFEEKTYAELVALCQFLPGPASSKLAIAMGMKRQGLAGGVVALTGFILPSTIIFIIIAYLVHSTSNAQIISSGLYGLQIAIIAIIGQALIKMIKRFCFDLPRIIIMLISAAINLINIGTFSQILSIITGIILGRFFIKQEQAQTKLLPVKLQENYKLPLAIYLILLIVLPLLHSISPAPLLNLFNIFYLTGSMVFGGGHIILPILEHQLLPSGLIDKNTFLIGYGLAQAMPGPLFSFVAYVGTSINISDLSWVTGLGSLVAVYLPSFLLLLTILPLWERWRHQTGLQVAMQGVNAAVTGMLLATFYNPILHDLPHSLIDIAYAILIFLSLEYFKLPQWLAIIICLTTTIIKPMLS